MLSLFKASPAPSRFPSHTYVMEAPNPGLGSRLPSTRFKKLGPSQPSLPFRCQGGSKRESFPPQRSPLDLRPDSPWYSPVQRLRNQYINHPNFGQKLDLYLVFYPAVSHPFTAPLRDILPGGSLAVTTQDPIHSRLVPLPLFDSDRRCSDDTVPSPSRTSIDASPPLQYTASALNI